jgi:menaquinone-dependent protoporphyrinogen oxidase
MRTAIVYASNHGTTESVARKIQQGLGEDKVQLFNLKKNKKFDLSGFDQVILGGSIHAGSVQKRIQKFTDSRRQELLEKRLGLYLCCMDEDRAREQFDNAYPEILRSHAVSKKIMGGEFRFERMNFIEKAMIKKISGVDQSVSKINEEKIREMISEMQPDS